VKIEDLASEVGDWLSGDGPDSDIVFSTRIRLARNIEGYPFVTKAAPEQVGEIEARLRDAIQALDLAPDMTYWNLLESSELDRYFLVEQHLISKEHAQSELCRGIAFTRSESLSMMVNEEDHLRMQVMQPGFQPETCWAKLDAADTALAQRLPWAWSERFGYLTACPTNVGTGMRVSVMLHLPALVWSRDIVKVFNAVGKIGMAVRGLYGEGTQATGDFYQISNQASLGKAEDRIVHTATSVVPQIVSYERKARDALLGKKRVELEDRVWRAVGILRSARSMSSEESMHCLSLARLGVHLGVLNDLNLRTVNELFVLSQPAHLQKLESREIAEPAERDIVRAAFIREAVGGA